MEEAENQVIGKVELDLKDYAQSQAAEFVHMKVEDSPVKGISFILDVIPQGDQAKSISKMSATKFSTRNIDELNTTPTLESSYMELELESTKQDNENLKDELDALREIN